MGYSSFDGAKRWPQREHLAPRTPWTLPRVTNGRYFGATLVCNDGYQAIGGQCQQLAQVTNGRYFGATLVCDDGYQPVGGQCRQLPYVTNGRYFGATLVCNDGYQATSGGCQQLPSVTNGRYFGATLVCYDGYQNVAGQCAQLAPVANSRYFGSAVVCDVGYTFDDGACTRTSNGGDIRSRIDPAAIVRSSLAPTGSYAAYDSSDYWSGYSAQSSSGTNFDATSGNRYSWTRDSDGSTRLRGMNLYTGSTWNTTIETDGSMRGYDKDFNPWRYESSSGMYINYGTGKMCVGKGAARSCF